MSSRIGLRFARAAHWAKMLAGNLGRSRIIGLSTELAFWIFLSLLPIAAVAGLVVARLAVRGDSALGGMLATVPPSVRDLLGNELTRVSAWNEGAVAPAAAATFVWLASSGVHAIFDALEQQTEANARPWWLKRTMAIVACIGLSLGVAAIAVLTAGLSALQKFAGNAVPLITGLPKIVSITLRAGFSLAIAVAMISGVYAIGLPPRARKRMPVIPGAMVAVLLMAALGIGYGTWVARMGDSGAYQAGLAVIGVTLMFLLLVSLALLVGAEVNQLVGARRLLVRSVHPMVAPPPPLTSAMRRCDDAPPEAEGTRRPSLASWAS